jgi:cytoskeletal protein RodZ
MSTTIAVAFVIMVLVVGALIAYAIYQWGQHLAISKNGPDLSAYVAATKNGEDFVALREAQGPEV